MFNHVAKKHSHIKLNICFRFESMYAKLVLFIILLKTIPHFYSNPEISEKIFHQEFIIVFSGWELHSFVVWFVERWLWPQVIFFFLFFLTVKINRALLKSQTNCRLWSIIWSSPKLQGRTENYLSNYLNHFKLVWSNKTFQIIYLFTEQNRKTKHLF